jgi:hypothetical protein
MRSFTRPVGLLAVFTLFTACAADAPTAPESQPLATQAPLQAQCQPIAGDIDLGFYVVSPELMWVIVEEATGALDGASVSMVRNLEQRGPLLHLVAEHVWAPGSDVDVIALIDDYLAGLAPGEPIDPEEPLRLLEAAADHTFRTLDHPVIDTRDGRLNNRLRVIDGSGQGAFEGAHGQFTTHGEVELGVSGAVSYRGVLCGVDWQALD